MLYTHAAVAEALTAGGVFSQRDGVLTADMEQLVALMESGAQWSDVGLPELYGSVTVGTTDPAKSNSGNMFAGLLANVLCGGSVGEEGPAGIAAPAPGLVSKAGVHGELLSDLFDQFLKTGMGAKPLIAGYESQLLEFAVQEPETWEQIKGDIVLVYPTPRCGPPMCSSPWMRAGALGIDALLDEEVQRLPGRTTAFARGVRCPHGHGPIRVEGVAEEVTQVAPMPGAPVMEAIIAALS